MSTQTELLQEAVACIREIADPIKFMRDRLNDGEQLNGGYAISLSNDPEFLKKIARTFLAKIDAEKWDGRAESEFQVISGDDEDAYIEAATRGPRDVALREAMRYAHQYAEDGPVKVVELVTVAMLPAARRQESE